MFFETNRLVDSKTDEAILEKIVRYSVCEKSGVIETRAVLVYMYCLITTDLVEIDKRFKAMLCAATPEVLFDAAEKCDVVNLPFFVNVMGPRNNERQLLQEMFDVCTRELYIHNDEIRKPMLNPFTMSPMRALVILNDWLDAVK